MPPHNLKTVTLIAATSIILFLNSVMNLHAADEGKAIGSSQSVSVSATCHHQCRCSDARVPEAARALGYIKRAINLCPTIPDISPDGLGTYSLYSGQWYRPPPSLSHYSMDDDALVINSGGDLTTISRDFKRKKLPLLKGSEGFYVEFDVRLSANDPDHWPALWLMPAEHNSVQNDHYDGDPKGFERWLELDVDEGGFGPGVHGAAISWSGIWPHYTKLQNPNNVSLVPLDRTVLHAFGASYDSIGGTVTWWLDGMKTFSAGFPYVPSIARRQNFYIIMGAQSHGESKPYKMIVERLRAFVSPTSSLPAQ
jgi:hypothetical protein